MLQYLKMKSVQIRDSRALCQILIPIIYSFIIFYYITAIELRIWEAEQHLKKSQAG